MGRIVGLMVLSYLIQTYASNPGIADLPLSLYLKETLNLSAAELAQFQGIVFLPWYIKPLWGIIADSFPLFGYSIKSYFLICYSLALFIFLGLSQIHSYTSSILLVSFVLISICIAFSDVLADKLMIVKGKVQQQTAIYQAAQWSAAGFGSAVMYYLGGWIAKSCTLSVAFLISAIVPLVGLVAALVLIKESKVKRDAVSVRHSMCTLWTAFKSGQVLAVLGFTAFLTLSPTPPLLFYQRDVLKFAEDFLGILGAISSLAFGLGAVFFGIFAPKVSRKILLNLIIGMSAIATLALGFIFDERSAILVQIVNGFVYAIALLGSLEITARVCPIGAAGTAYTLLLSVANLTTTVAGISGGWLYDRGMPFPVLVIISAVFTSFCWFLIPLLQLEQAEL
jgi:MFS family permease